MSIPAGNKVVGGSGHVTDHNSITNELRAIRAGLPLSVTDYGAVGDGTTDDTAAIAATITASGWPNNAARIVFPPLSYKITSTIAINGAGLTSTPQLVIDGYGARLVSTTPNLTMMSITDSVVSVTYIQILGLTFNNNGGDSLHTDGYCVSLNAAEAVTFRDCTFGGSFTNGIKMSGLTCPYVSVVNCTFFNMRRGIETASNAQQLLIQGCQFGEQLAGSPLNWVELAGETDGAKIVNNTFYCTGATLPSVRLYACHESTVTGNTFHRSPLEAVYLQPGSDHNTISANTFLQGSRGDIYVNGASRCTIVGNTHAQRDAGVATDTYSAIRLKDPFGTNPKGFVVMGNVSTDTASALAYVVEADATVQNTVVLGNTGAAGYSAPHVSNVVANNITG